MTKLVLAALLCAGTSTIAAEPFIPSVPDKQPEPPFPPTPPGAGITMLVPGFTVRELPVKLTNLNNVEYAPDGRLFAGGYDGRFHVLRDTNGDGLEDKVDTFAPATNENYPLGMAVKDGALYTVLANEVVRFRDTDGDGVPETRETVLKDFDDPELVKARYLMHRRVDSSMAIGFGPDGALHVTMGNGQPGNAYWTDKAGPHYSTMKRRGCLLRLGDDGKIEQLATGLRYIMSLQWNRHGDLFGTDQEGATWVPNGNPFDELLHIQAGRHYGFPPRHPKWLPDVIDEPSVWDYAPQHQSACGFRFNGPSPGRGRFGPEFWAGDAIVTGEARGKLWRTTVAKTAAGYVARNEAIARLGMMPVDCAISPQGDLVVCCHSGAPDWGNGPKGEGCIFKISYTDKAAPQPVLTYAAAKGVTVIDFDRSLATRPDARSGRVAKVDFTTRTKVEAGLYVSAADRLEKMRPGYAVVKMQQKHPRTAVAVKFATTQDVRTEHSWEQRSILICTEPRTDAVNYAVSITGESPLEVAYGMSGVSATWSAGECLIDFFALPHLDFAAAREFTRGSATHARFWKYLDRAGYLHLRGQLDLWRMLTPATQPLSKLDYTPDPEIVTVVFKSPHAIGLSLTAAGAKVQAVSATEARLTVTAPQEDVWQPYELEMKLPATNLDVSYFTNRDPRPRALPTRRILLPFATSTTIQERVSSLPEIAGGNWQAGRDLFKGKATCATCHQLRGDGVTVGPDLGNLIHRDYASVLKDIAEPSAAINPDAVGYVVTLNDGLLVTGTRLAETGTELHIAQTGGAVAKLKKSDISKTDPMTVSLMPAGLHKALTPDELRDLMTYLLLAAPLPAK